LSTFFSGWDDETLVNHWNALMSDTSLERGIKIGIEAAAKKVAWMEFENQRNTRFEAVEAIRALDPQALAEEHSHEE
jgi:hypothetical protein